VKLGDRVHLKFVPPTEPAAGTVVELRGRWFRVTWDSVDRNPGRPRFKSWHDRDALKHGMEVGNP
jgi:hypothetical protein